MNTIIRKISVGSDYPNGVLHYQVGKNISLLNKTFEIKQIVRELLPNGYIFKIYIYNGIDTVLWKEISGLPVVVENDIMFQ